jgi:WD40 repeat protein
VIDAQSPDQPLFLTRNAHAAEVWCCAWLSCDLFMTGADDCMFKLWDRRCPEAAVSSVRSHDAGVTFLGRTPGAANPNACDDVFASGSYDGYACLCLQRCWRPKLIAVFRSIKLWDMRVLGPGTSKGGRGCLASLDIEGGGVWAVDWAPLPNGGYLGAVAAM